MNGQERGRVGAGSRMREALPVTVRLGKDFADRAWSSKERGHRASQRQGLWNRSEGEHLQQEMQRSAQGTRGPVRWVYLYPLSDGEPLRKMLWKDPLGCREGVD